MDEAVGQVYAARAQAEAVELNRSGHYEAAERLLTRMRDKIGKYAGRSPVLARELEVLQQASWMTSDQMTPIEMKQMHFRAESALRSRSADGTARRKPDGA